MATARERYLNAVSPRAAASSEGVSPSAAANAEAAASVPPAPAAPSPRWSNRSSTAARTSELTSPAVTPRGAGRNAIASSPRAALSSSSANGRSPAVTSASAPTSTAAGNATAAAASPAAPSSNSYPKPMSGRKPGGSTGAAKSRAVEARLSAAMAISAGGSAVPSPSPGTPGGGPVSDDDYFTDDGLLDRAKVVSPRHQMDDMVAGIRSPTNARNARLTGAAPPPTLGEIESHLHGSHATTNTTSSMASPGGRSTRSTASGGNRARPMPENGMGGGGNGGGAGGRSHRKPGKKLGRGFFDESFEEAFPADDNLDAFNTSVDRGTSTTNNNQNPNLQKGRAAPSPSAQRKADRGAATGGDAQKALHDPFGTMPSLPTPTSSSSGGAAAAGHESTSVAARRRARAAATTGGLSIDTGLATSPTAAGHAADAGDATSPATMLDFALQGTPVAAAAAAAGGAGYPSDDDKEQEGVLGAVASPRSWKGASAAAGSGKVDTSREGLIGSDELSPSNAPTVMSDAEARLEEEERKRREAEEKKNRFLSKMILRVSCSQQQDG